VTALYILEVLCYTKRCKEIWNKIFLFMVINEK